MSNPHDITNKRQPATKWADYRTESENHAILDRVYVTHEKVHHHNDRGKKPEEIIPQLREMQI